MFLARSVRVVHTQAAVAPPLVHIVARPSSALTQRFSQPLPAATEPFFSEPFRFPPRGYVIARVQSGDRRMRDGLAESLREAAKQERPFDLQLTFGALLRECAEQPSVARWIQGWRDREPEERVRSVLSYALGEAGPRPMTPAPGLRPDLEALEARAREPVTDEAAAVSIRDALLELAHHARPRAVKVARTRLAGPTHPWLRPICRALDLHPRPGALEAWLAGAGFAVRARSEGPGAWAEAVLARAGLVVSADREELVEDLLYRCSAAAAGELTGVQFEEVPPEAVERYPREAAELLEPVAPGEPEPVILWAHDRSASFATSVDPGGPSVDAVVELLNRCLRERGSVHRVARLVTDRPRLAVGPEPALDAAADKGLLLLAR